MRTAATSTDNGHTICVSIFLRQQVIQDPDAGQYLHGHGQAAAMIFKLKLQHGLAPGKQIVAKGHGAHTGECCTTILAVGTITLLLPVTIRIEYYRYFAFVF